MKASKMTASVQGLSVKDQSRLLIVDDEIELMDTLCKMLTEQGYETVGVSSGLEALELMEVQDFDLLLTDLMMPEMDGIALLQAAQEIDPHLMSIIMTGQGTIQTSVQAMKIGAFDYVLKPFKLQALLPVLSRALQVRRLKMENLQLREMVTIHELAQTIAHTLDLETILNKVADGAMQQCQADEVSIMLPTSEGDDLYIAVTRGEARGKFVGQRVPLEQSIAGWVMSHHKPLTLHGSVNDPNIVPFNPRTDIWSAISHPLLVGGKLVGVLNINATHRRRPFTGGEVKALSILASTAAATLETASLYAEVQAAEEKYRSIFENAVEGIFQRTPDGHFLTANPALARILGYESPEELIASITDMTHQVYVHPDARSECTRLMQKHGVVSGFESQVYRKDGRVIWISESLRVVRDTDGEITSYEGTVEDITERKRAEKQLKAQTQELQEAYDNLKRTQAQLMQSEKMAAIGQLAAGVAHEINNPIAFVSSNLNTFGEYVGDLHTFMAQNERVMESLKRLEPTTIKNLVNCVNGLKDKLDIDFIMSDLTDIVTESKTGIDRVRQIVQDLKDFAHVDETEFQLVDINEGIEKTLQLVWNEIKYKTTVEKDYGDIPQIACMPGQLNQVYMNLLVNASQAIGKHGVIRIKTHADETNVYIEISDNGCGIADEDLSRIFDAFFTTKPVGEGTGLGLSISYTIIQKHGGDIRVESEEGKGTTLCIALPIAGVQDKSTH